MSESEYNNKVAEAVIAYVHHLVSYKEWYDYMTKLIERRQNNDS
jgi:hypothetical protein